MADVFTRLSEQAAGTAEAAQPSHAPFFAPLRDVDLPSPAAVPAGAPEAATAFAPWADDAAVAARTGWLDPLIPPDAIWADRPVPTLAWLASTVPPDAAASPGDAPVAAPAMPPAEGLEPSAEGGLRPPEALDATTLSDDAAVLAPTVTTAAVALAPPSAPAGLSDFGPNRQAGGTAVHDATIEVNVGGPAGAAHAAANALVPHDGSESPAAVPAPLPLAPARPDLRDEALGAAPPPVQTTRQLSSAAAEGRPPAENKVVDVQGSATLPLPRKTSSPTEAAPARLEPYAQPGLLRPEADFAQPVAEPGTGSQQHRLPDAEGEPRLHREGEMASGSTSIQPILPQRAVGAPGQEGSAGGIVPAQAGQAADVLSQSATAARQTDQPTAAVLPGEGTGAPPFVPGIPATGGHVLPRTVPAPQTSPEAQASTAIGTASKQALVAAATAMDEASPHDKSTRDVPAIQVAQAPDTLLAASRSPVQPAVTPSERRGDAMPGVTSIVAGAPVADSTGVKHQEPRVAALPQAFGHVEAVRPVEPVRTAAGHEVVQSTGVTSAELRHASSTEAAVRALTAPPPAVPHAQAHASPAASTEHAFAPVPPPSKALRQPESAWTAGSLQAVHSTRAPGTEPPHTAPGESPARASAARPITAVAGQANAMPALEVATVSALSQPRNEALAPYLPAQPMADAQMSMIDAQESTGRPAAAARAGRHAEPQALPTVHVTIGRIEVRFATPTVEQVPSARQPSRQNLPLHAILQRDVWEAD